MIQTPKPIVVRFTHGIAADACRFDDMADALRWVARQEKAKDNLRALTVSDERGLILRSRMPGAKERWERMRDDAPTVK